MPTLQVRNLPENIYRRLKERARREHRSITQQAIVALARGLGLASDARERRAEIVSDISAGQIRFAGYDLSDPVELLREDRGR